MPVFEHKLSAKGGELLVQVRINDDKTFRGEWRFTSVDEEAELIGFSGKWDALAETSYALTVESVGGARQECKIRFDIVSVTHMSLDNTDYEGPAAGTTNGDGTWNALMYAVSPRHMLGKMSVVLVRVLKGKV